MAKYGVISVIIPCYAILNYSLIPYCNNKEDLVIFGVSDLQ